MAVEFKCKETGCSHNVSYEPKTTPGSFGALFRKSANKQAMRTFAAYLVCPDGHVHRYEIPTDAAGI